MFLRTSFNPQPLKAKMQAASRGFQRSLPEELRRAGRVASVSLAKSTVPYGVDEHARKMGESAAAADVRRCYATPADVFKAFPDKHKANSFWKAIAKGNFSAAQTIMQKYCPRFHGKQIRPMDNGQAHRANRNSRGRVSKKQEPIFVVQTTRNLFAYIKEEVRHVGEGKAGWAGCAKILGSMRGIPQWVTRHAGKLSKATVIEDRNATAPTITLRNEVAYSQDILSEPEKQIAIRIAIDRLSKGIFIAELQARRASALTS